MEAVRAARGNDAPRTGSRSNAAAAEAPEAARLPI
jgi:hypothetical protein